MVFEWIKDTVLGIVGAQVVYFFLWVFFFGTFYAVDMQQTFKYLVLKISFYGQWLFPALCEVQYFFWLLVLRHVPVIGPGMASFERLFFGGRFLPIFTGLRGVLESVLLWDLVGLGIAGVFGVLSGIVALWVTWYRILVIGGKDRKMRREARRVMVRTIIERILAGEPYEIPTSTAYGSVRTFGWLNWDLWKRK